MKSVRGRVYVRKDQRTRFETKYERRGPEECWPWHAAANEQGRGRFFWSYEEPGITAPVAALRLAGIAIPAGKLACHRCDNPRCVNPNHLYVGDHSDNITDAWQRGQRSRSSRLRGSAHGMSKLDEADVRRIRDLHAAGTQQTQIAAEMGIGKTTVCNVVHGRTWKHV